ncbi:MAG: hypothetical protein ACYDG4_15130 [Desulfuromonadaceae bacterium]
MAEVATIYEINQNPGVKTTLAGKVARFCTQDAAEPGLNNPCKVPPTGTYNSFRKTHCLGITGDFNQVRDIFIHGDGQFATDWGLDHANGGTLFIATKDTGDNGLPIDAVLHGSNEYAVATGDVGTSGHDIDDPVNGHPYYREESTPQMDFDECLANTPLLIDSGPYVDDFYSKAWVLCLTTVPTSIYGAKSPKAAVVTYNIF